MVVCEVELEDEADGWPMGMSTVSEIGKEDEGGGVDENGFIHE